jgi:hypothetical protein
VSIRLDDICEDGLIGKEVRAKYIEEHEEIIGVKLHWRCGHQYEGLG